ncbi:hypothetical protein TIFTF001_024432 [Ficus carica]|uniref:Uncharacterized protein n=1 Tax=Ficus carica TaxID=3494 RepID=A0AA88DKD3_FICCA|nr:hypothetical protein TIFTF001_024432 [Ficus carica]
MTAITEMAHDACVPSIPPVWQRHLLNARNPLCITRHIALCSLGLPKFLPFGEWFQFTNKSGISSFELLAAFLWRCRTIALHLNPEEGVHVVVNVNKRSKFKPLLPRGYYGNAIAFATARTTAGKLCSNPLVYAIGLVKRAKGNVTEEYMRSLADLINSRGSVLCRVRSKACRVRRGGIRVGKAGL